MKIIILGKGNAGCYTALHFKHYAPNIDVELIYDKDTPSLTVGQASFTDAPQLLWRSLQVDWYKNPIKSTFKTGILYKNWGKYNDEFFHPFAFNALSLHYDTQELQNYILNSGLFKVTTKKINSYDELDANYIIDCRGWPKNYDNYEILENPLNSVLLSNKKEQRSTHHWTTANATPDGWCFEIPLVDYVSLGYLYNDTITTEEQALDNFKSMFGIEKIYDKFKFKNYVAKNPIIDERIILNGNQLFFLEPLESTAVTTFLNWTRNIFDFIVTKKLTSLQATQIMKNNIYKVQNFILYHYLHGSKFETPFWNYCKNYKIKDKEFWESLQKSLKMSNTDLVYDDYTYGVHSLYSFNNMYKGICMKNK